MAIMPWYGSVLRGLAYDAAEFLQTNIYTNVSRYVDDINVRPAAQRGISKPLLPKDD